MKKEETEYLPTRASLLGRLKNWDDHRSWQEFAETYRDLILGAAIKAGLSSEEAADVVQETLLTVAKKIKEFEYDPKGSFKAWLLNTAKWRIGDQFRKRQQLPAAAVGAGADTSRTSTINRIPDPSESELDTLCEEEWAMHIGRIALERVKKRCNPLHFQVFDLYVRQELPVEQIVRTLGVSEASVYQVKTRISKQLQKEVAALEALRV